MTIMTDTPGDNDDDGRRREGGREGCGGLYTAKID